MLVYKSEIHQIVRMGTAATMQISMPHWLSIKSQRSAYHVLTNVCKCLPWNCCSHVEMRKYRNHNYN